MTHDQDPTRWTSSPDEAPELLRGAFISARDEGPNRAQVRSLALKLAAASAGGAVAIGTVKAASAGQAITTAATWSVGKVAAVVALAGTLVTGGALVWQANTSTQRPDSVPNGAATSEAAAVEAAAAATASEPSQRELSRQTGMAGSRTNADVTVQGQAPVVEKLTTPTVEPLRGAESARATGPFATAAASTHEGASKIPSVHAKSRSATAREKPKPTAKAALAARVEPQTTAAKSGAESAPATSKPNAPSSEIELLRRAQVALQSRPREAFQLTQEHRRLYPAGEFAQERDALAIQALMRVGDTEKARDLASSFIRSYPSSPHAHRFREAMGLD